MECLEALIYNPQALSSSQKLRQRTSWISERASRGIRNLLHSNVIHTVASLYWRVRPSREAWGLSLDVFVHGIVTVHHVSLRTHPFLLRLVGQTVDDPPKCKSGSTVLAACEACAHMH